LLDGPFRCGMSSHSKVQNPPAIMRQHQKHVRI
jgi:hypothetical protein